MQKTMFLIRGKDETYPAFRKRIFGKASQIEPVYGLSLTITEKAPPRLSVIPFRREKIAVVSAYDDPAPAIPVLETTEGFAGAYRVEEAFPIAYQRTWPDGEATPGVCLLTLFRQKRSIDRGTFIDRWHNGHTPLSLRLHPLWHYNRNLVWQPLYKGSVPYDGIVEEHFRKASDLLNPAHFFGHPAKMLYNMLEVYLDVRSFLDYGSIEPYLVKEYHLKSV